MDSVLLAKYMHIGQSAIEVIILFLKAIHFSFKWGLVGLGVIGGEEGLSVLI